MAQDLIMGSHISMKSPGYYLDSVKEALELGETTFMFYTGAPQSSYRVPLEQCKIEEGRQLIKKSGIDETKIVVHAPYILNLGNDSDINKWIKSKELVKNEIIRTEAFGCSIMVLHPGAHVGLGLQHSVQKIVQGLDEIFDEIPNSKVKIALETMAGKGTEVGSKFQEIADIIKNSRHCEKLGVCLDTCHINDAGYNVFSFDKVLDEFDSIIGLERLLVIHVNDSKNPIGAHKDRHENIGYGEIGFEALNKIVNHLKLKDVPKILETPYVNDRPPYKKEIEMFRNEKFEEGWRDKL